MIWESFAKGIVASILFMLGLAMQGKASACVFFTGLLGALLGIGYTLRPIRSSKVQTKAVTVSSIMFALLETPAPLMLGIIIGMVSGSVLAGILDFWDWQSISLALLAGLVSGGAIIGLRRIHHRLLRRGTVLLVIAGLMWLLLWWLTPTGSNGTRLPWLGVHLILAAALWYGMTFLGRTEESELEIGVICLLLGLALWSLVPAAGPLVSMVVPVVIYLAYTQYVLRETQSFKAELHGLIAAREGATIQALTKLRRAIQFAPHNRSARESLWKVHRQIDLHEVQNDPRLLRLIDFDLCLHRARELLFADSISASAVDEAKQLLNLVAEQKTEQLPEVLYYRSVAFTHAGEFDKAASALLTLLDPGQFGPDQQVSRDKVLLDAWSLALLQHGELRNRAGELLLNQSRRMDAIADLEKHAKVKVLDETGLKLKHLLYQNITQTEYDREAGDSPLQQAMWFDHRYLYEQGLDKLDDAEQWKRGRDWLRIALRGQPRHAPAVLKLIADAAAQHGDKTEEKRALIDVKKWSKLLGLGELSPESKTAYFATIRRLAEDANRASDHAEALENYLLCLEDPASAADTLRIIAELYERQGDVLNTFLYNEQCLMYDAKNPIYLERRDRVYVSLQPEDISRHLEKIDKIVEQSYLISKIKQLLESPNSGRDQFEWALHLANLLVTISPERVAGWVLLGRTQLRMGQAASAVESLEKGYRLGKEQKPGGDDLDAWYVACRILGDHYLQQERYAEAVSCFSDYQQSTKSGADTLFKLGQASEKLGENNKAKKYYEHANMFDHPNKYEVSQALARLHDA